MLIQSYREKTLGGRLDPPWYKKVNPFRAIKAPPPRSTFDSRIHDVFWQNSRGHDC